MSTLNQWNSSVNWYDQNMGESGDTLNQNLIHPIIFDLLHNLKRAQILDCGCGSGYLSAELATKAKKVVGTDFSQDFIKLCQRKYQKISNLSFSHQDITQPMDFETNSFQIVLSKMVLQYVPSIDLFAQETFRILTHPGKLMIIVDHPFDTQFYFAQQLVGKKNPKYYDLHDYFSTQASTKLSLWGKVELTWYPRTISEYINTFINKGFFLSQIKELPQIVDGINIPRILVLLFEK